MNKNKGEKTISNSTFSIGAVPYSVESFVVTVSSVLRINIRAEKPTHRKSINSSSEPPYTKFDN